MRVLHVSPGVSARIGGSAMMALESLEPLKAVGVDAVIFAPDVAVGAQSKQYSTVSERDAVRPAIAATRLFRTRPPRRLLFSPSLQRALSGEVGSFDVVHIHNLWTYPQFAAYFEAEKRNVPYVVAPCGAFDPMRRRRSRVVKWLATGIWQRRMLERAAIFHFKSENEADRASDVLPNDVPVAIVPNGIDWQAYQELPAGRRFRTERLGGHRGPVVMTIGRISWEKRLDLLIRAFAAIAAAAPDAILAIVGPDDEGLARDLKSLAERLDIADRVSFPGVVTGEDKLAALAAADVWCLCSWFENFGLAALEAIAAGLPVVMTEGVQISQEITAAGAGLVAAPAPAEFGQAVLDLLRHPRDGRELGERGRELARRYDWPRVAPELVKMYRHACRSGPPK